MRIASIVPIASFLLHCFLSIGQESKVELLKTWEDQNEHDTVRLEALDIAINKYYISSDFDSSEYLGREMIKLASVSGWDKWIGAGYNTVGQARFYKGNFQGGIEPLDTALFYFEKIGYQKGISDAKNNLGICYAGIDENDMAADYYLSSLEIKNELEDWVGKSNVLGNLGNMHYHMSEYEKAQEYYIEAYELSELINDASGMSRRGYSIGAVTLALSSSIEDEDDRKASLMLAKEYFQNTINISEENGFTVSKAYAMLGLASAYDDLGQKDSAIIIYEETIVILTELGDIPTLMVTYQNLGATMYKMGNLNMAIKYCEKSLEFSRGANYWDLIRESSNILYKAYKDKGNYKSALEMHEEYLASKDSLTKEENKQALFEKEVEFEYQQKTLADSIKAAEGVKLAEANLALEKEENARQKQKSYFLYAGLALLLGFGIFVFNRLKISRRQNQIISEQKRQVEHQKDEIQEAHQEITDSIQYAKRIQTAILPPSKLVKEYLNNSFILYKPKDVVAGDFYWMDPQKDRVLFAAADCTGHGVPGAMVSVICNNGLNRSAREFGLSDPGEILDKTRELVIAEFEKSEEEVKDGMDIALCALETDTSGASVSLKYAGAHNPLWIIRKGATEVEEIKADKQPIGKYAEPKPFTTHQVELNPGDTFYTFSDGFADQFGGEKGKKFKSANFKKLLLSMQNESMDRQKELIDEAFEKWKGNLEQLDDVCVIGVRV